MCSGSPSIVRAEMLQKLEKVLSYFTARWLLSAISISSLLFMFNDGVKRHETHFSFSLCVRLFVDETKL